MEFTNALRSAVKYETEKVGVAEFYVHLGNSIITLSMTYLSVRVVTWKINLHMNFLSSIIQVGFNDMYHVYVLQKAKKQNSEYKMVKNELPCKEIKSN